METKIPERTKSSFSPMKHNQNHENLNEDEDFVPMQMSRKGKTNNFKGCVDEDLKKKAEDALKD